MAYVTEYMIHEATKEVLYAQIEKAYSVMGRYLSAVVRDLPPSAVETLGILSDRIEDLYAQLADLQFAGKF